MTKTFFSTPLHRRAAILFAALAFAALAAAPARALTLVENGEPRAVVVIQNADDMNANAAIDEFIKHIQMATGAKLGFVHPDELADLPKGTARVLIGDGPLTREHGVDVTQLEPEQYRIKVAGDTMVLAGHDLGEINFATNSMASPASLYAVCHWLDRDLGVRWLWPGELGTYVPKRKTIAVGERDETAQPDLLQRRFRAGLWRWYERSDAPPLVKGEERAKYIKEAELWQYHQMMGSRSNFRFGHNFGDWWAKYHESHPEYFAKAPEGYEQPFPRAPRVKLDVSNPAVAEQILQNWRDAGRPDNFNVCPNDGSGFCVCDECQKLDGVEHESDEAVWRGKANITGRYVALWNKLLKAMKKENPNATLSSYAYSAYRDPLPGMKLEDGMILGIVHTYKAYDEWKKLSDLGAKLFLRPNWFHSGATAPHIPIHWQGEYMRFCREHSMVGFDFDSLTGAWGTESPLYYVDARIGHRPDLSVDECIDEYCSAFGKGAPAIEKYIGYWEDYTEKCAFPVAAGGWVSIDSDGLYEQAVREHGISPHPIRGSWQALPYLYTDEVIAPSEKILSEAERAIGDGDKEALARVQFLRDGLKHLRLLRDAVELAYLPDAERQARQKEFEEACLRLQEARREMTPRHVVWGDFFNYAEKRYGIKIVPKAVEESLEGM